MVDLTNYNDKRGVVILSAKDVRRMRNAILDIEVYTSCIERYIKDLEKYTEALELTAMQRIDIDAHIDAIKNWNRGTDKARKKMSWVME